MSQAIDDKLYGVHPNSRNIDMPEKSHSSSPLPLFPWGKGINMPNLLLLCLSLLLAGCGIIDDYARNLASGGGTGASGKSASANTQPTATPKSNPIQTPVSTSTLGIEADRLQGLHITIWHAWMGGPRQVIESQISEFNRSNPWGIQVEATAQGSFDQISDQIVLAGKNGELPNITVAYLYQALAWDASGARLADLTAYVDDPVWGMDEQARADFYPVFWEHDQVSKQRYGVPAQGSAQVLYYNTTWARELGFDAPPHSPEEFRAQACAAAQTFKRDSDPRNDQMGGWIISTDYSAVLGWMYAFGAEIQAADGEGYRFDTPQVEETFDFLRGLLDSGCAWLGESQTPEAEFAARQGLFATGSVAGILYQEEAFIAAGSQDEWDVIPFPSPRGEPTIVAYGPSFQILRSTPDRQLASWLFVQWLSGAERQAQLAQVSGYFPVRASSLEHMGVLPAAHPQWQTAVDLLSYARPEPALHSWHVVRWTVEDAATQLFRYYFEQDRVPVLVKLLDETANELHRELK
jgi:ABC-type glycerol-3-phosphate transport system substrate-binding protein